MKITPAELTLLQAISTIIAICSGLGGLLYGGRWFFLKSILGRTWIHAWRAKHKLAAELDEARTENARLMLELGSAKNQALSAFLAASNWEKAVDGLRVDTDLRLRRLEEEQTETKTRLDELAPKFADAVVYIKTLTMHIMRLLRKMLDAGIPYEQSFGVPEPPPLLIEELKR